ncbi:hypothetical protein CAEBREN_31598, partial [Caenorhabditis brenneri]
MARENPKSLRILHNELYAIINSLKNQGTEIETQNYQVEIKKKLPRSILVDLLKAKPADTTNLLKELDLLITIEESAQQSVKSTEKEERTVLAVKGSPQNKTCKFCNRKNHSTIECRTVQTLEDRRKFVKDNNLCFLCLIGGHRVSECKFSECRKCQQKHNQALCPKNTNVVRKNYNTNTNHKNESNQKTNSRNFNQNNGNQQSAQRSGPYNQSNQKPHGQGYQQKSQDNQNGQKNQNGQNQHSGYKKPQGQSVPNKNSTKNYQVSANKTSLMVANAPVLVGNEIEQIPVLFDTGAEESFVLSSYAEKANMKVLERNIEIDICVFGREPTPIISNKVEFEIITNQDENSAIRVVALTVPDITDLFDPVDLTFEDKHYLEKTNQKVVNITRPEKAVALLGCDVFWELVVDGKRKLPSGKFIVPTQIGTVICGSSEKPTTSMHALIARMREHKENKISETSLEEYFEISNIGITEEIHDPTNDEIIANFEKTVKFNKDTNRVIVALPWKTGQREKLANNREVAVCRLRQQQRSTISTDAWKKLIENFETMENSGIVEEIDNDPDIGFYIPYGLVFNTNSNTTKVRTVFDASSKKRGERSLNNALHQGPSLVPDMQGILLRLRQGIYLLSGDIEKAFHAVEVNENDRDALRFIWLKDPYGPVIGDNLRFMRFTRLPFGVNCSPFLLSMSILHAVRHADVPEQLVKSIETMCYVDNIFMLTDDFSKLPEIYTQLKVFFKSIGMNIREFSLNHCENFIKDEDKAKNLDNVKMLGYLYDLINDTFEVKKPKLEWQETSLPTLTKKKAVGEITLVFDPTQYFAPLYLDGKLILRSISDHSLKWTDH